MQPITLDEAEYIAHRLVSEMMDYGEPMGDFLLVIRIDSRVALSNRLEHLMEKIYTQRY